MPVDHSELSEYLFPLEVLSYDGNYLKLCRDCFPLALTERADK